MTLSPMETLVEWLRDVPESLAQEFAGYVLCSVPEGWFSPLVDADDPFDFRGRLVADASGWVRSQGANVGSTLALAAIIDFVLATRATPACWEDLMDRNSRFIFKARSGDTGLEDVLLNQRRRDAELAPQWMKVAASWRDLRSSALSPTAIEGWAQEHFAYLMGIGNGPAIDLTPRSPRGANAP